MTPAWIAFYLGLILGIGGGVVVVGLILTRRHEDDCRKCILKRHRNV